MSNFYSDQSGCRDCRSTGKYVDLGNLTDYECDQPCICRHTSERSTKDKMMYDWFVLNQPMNLPMYKGSNNVSEGYAANMPPGMEGMYSSYNSYNPYSSQASNSCNSKNG